MRLFELRLHLSARPVATRSREYSRLVVLQIIVVHGSREKKDPSAMEEVLQPGSSMQTKCSLYFSAVVSEAKNIAISSNEHQ